MPLPPQLQIHVKGRLAKPSLALRCPAQTRVKQSAEVQTVHKDYQVRVLAKVFVPFDELRYFSVPVRERVLP